MDAKRVKTLLCGPSAQASPGYAEIGRHPRGGSEGADIPLARPELSAAHARA